MSMKITNTKDKNPIELPNCNSVEDFKREWVNQGGTIRFHNEERGDMEIVNQDGKRIYCIILGDSIFPFDFGDN